MGNWSPAYVAAVRSVYVDSLKGGPVFEVLGFEDLQARLKSLGDPTPAELAAGPQKQVQAWTSIRNVCFGSVSLLSRHPELIYPACAGDAKDCDCQGHKDLKAAEAAVKPQASAESWEEYKKRKAAIARKMKTLAEKPDVEPVKVEAPDPQDARPQLDEEGIRFLERVNAHNEGETEQYFSSATLSENDQVLARGLEAQGWLEAFHQPGVSDVQWVHTRATMEKLTWEHNGVNPTDKIVRSSVRLVDGITATKARTEALAKKALEKVGAPKPKLTPRMVAFLERVIATERDHELLLDDLVSHEEREASGQLARLGLIEQHLNQETEEATHRATRAAKLMFSFGAATPDPASFDLVEGPAPVQGPRRHRLPCGCVHDQQLEPGEKVVATSVVEMCEACKKVNAEFVRPVSPEQKVANAVAALGMVPGEPPPPLAVGFACGCAYDRTAGGGFLVVATCPKHPPIEPPPLPAGHPDAAEPVEPVRILAPTSDPALEAAKLQAKALYETLVGPVPNLKPLEDQKLALQDLAQERAEQLAEVEKARQELLAVWTAENQELERLRARVAELEARPAQAEVKTGGIREFAEFVRAELERYTTESRNSPPPATVPRSSSLGKPCIRYGVLEVLGAPKSELTLDSLGRFEVGDLWEAEIGRKLRFLGFKLERTQETLEFYDPENPSVLLWKGHWDGVLSHPLWPGLAIPVVDVKSMMHVIWKGLWAHHADNPTEALLAAKELHVRTYVDQILSYLMAAKIPHGLLIFVSKDIGLVKVVPIVRNADRERWLIEKAREIGRVSRQARALNKPVLDLPEDLMPPFTPHLEECERCDFRDVSCFPKAEIKGDHIVSGPPELLEALGDWIPTKGAASQAEKLKELIRPRFASMPVGKYHVPGVGTVNVRQNKDGTVVVDARPIKTTNGETEGAQEV